MVRMCGGSVFHAPSGVFCERLTGLDAVTIRPLPSLLRGRVASGVPICSFFLRKDCKGSDGVSSRFTSGSLTWRAEFGVRSSVASIVSEVAEGFDTARKTVGREGVDRFTRLTLPE